MQNFACKKDCLLWAILDKITRRILFNCELIADLSDLQHNEPERLTWSGDQTTSCKWRTKRKIERCPALALLPGKWLRGLLPRRRSQIRVRHQYPRVRWRNWWWRPRSRDRNRLTLRHPDTQHPNPSSVSCNGQKPVPSQDGKKR